MPIIQIETTEAGEIDLGLGEAKKCGAVQFIYINTLAKFVTVPCCYSSFSVFTVIKCFETKTCVPSPSISPKFV